MGLLRLFLALVVALSHLQNDYLSGYGFAVDWHWFLGINAGFAVMWFYMISGFLISMVLEKKYPRSVAGILSFYAARIVRIFSLYWPILFIFIIFFIKIRQKFFDASYFDQFTNIFLFGADWRFAFAAYPNLHADALPTELWQAWTLGAELTFYALAPLLLRSWKLTVGLLILSGIIRAICVFEVDGFSTTWTYMFFPTILIFFLLGHVARSAAVRWPIFGRTGAGAILLTLSFGSLLIDGPADWDSIRFWIAALCFAAALPGVFAVTRTWRSLNALGDLSYPLYLTHTAAMSVLFKVIPLATLTEWCGASGTYVAGIVGIWVFFVAVAAHQLIERPTKYLMTAYIKLRQPLAITLMNVRLPRSRDA
jgi:peptidoglycan/LPS O-acetylase OafA/YrhL